MREDLTIRTKYIVGVHEFDTYTEAEAYVKAKSKKKLAVTELLHSTGNLLNSSCGPCAAVIIDNWAELKAIMEGKE